MSRQLRDPNFDTRTKRIRIALSEKLYQEIKQHAEQDDWTFNEEIDYFLRSALRDHRTA